jgi:aminoglycoside phosphotransferase (APT) family kinase protein
MSDELIDLGATLRLYLARAHPAWTAPVVRNLTSINAGWECDVYSFDLEYGAASARLQIGLVLRIYPGADAYVKSDREFRGMQLLQRAAYPVPAVYLLERDASPIGRPFVIMERIEGQQLWPVLFYGPEADQPSLLTLFCSLIVQLHELDWHPFVQGPSEDILADPHRLIEREMLRWQAVMEQHPAPGFQPTVDWLHARQARVRSACPGPVHWDFHPANVLLRPDGSARVIDWTQIDISDTRFDLGWTLLLVGSSVSETWRDRVLAEYERLIGRAVEDLDFFEVAAGLKRLYSSYLSVAIGAEKLGMRPGAEKTMMQNAPKLHAAYRMIYSRTHLQIPELDELLGAP